MTDPHPTRENAPTSRPAAAIAVGGVLAFLVGCDSMVVAPIAPTILAGWGVPAGLSSLLVAAYALAYALTSPLFGALTDRAGRRRVAMVGIVVFAAGTALTGFAPGFAVAMTGRAVAGAGAGAILPTVFAEVSDRSTDATRGANIGLVMGLMPAATVIGVPLGALLAAATGWPWVFHAIAIAGLCCLPPAARAFSGTPVVRNAVPAGSQAFGDAVRDLLRRLRGALTSRETARVLAATFLWNSGLAVLFTSIGAFYQWQFGITTAAMSGVMFAAGVAGVVGSVGGGRLLSRWGTLTHLVVCGAVAAGGVLTMVLSRVLGLSIAGNVIWSCAIVAGQPALTTLAASLDPRARGTILALNGSAQYLAQFAASSAAALIVGLTGSYSPLGVLAAILPLTVLLIVRPVRAS
ncbi:MAG: MFS transporter [Acidipropionibacterium sp.]|jgi:predicted MFS family arabinose efflux permease|nr:MFS transporter [Acidipropionibacterium sp.]